MAQLPDGSIICGAKCNSGGVCSKCGDNQPASYPGVNAYTHKGKCRVEGCDGFMMCRLKPMTGRERCRVHGGSLNRGYTHNAIRHGRHTKARMQLPKRLIESYEKFVSDPELMSGREDVAVLKCRQQELANRLDTGESGALWNRLADAYIELRAAMAEGDKEASKAAFNQIGDLIEKGQADGAIWGEFREITLEIDQLRNSEVKRVREAGKSLTVQEATAFAGALTLAVKNNVLNSLKEIGQEKLAKHILRKINEEIRELMTLGSDEPSELDDGEVVEGRIAT